MKRENALLKARVRSEPSDCLASAWIGESAWNFLVGFGKPEEQKWRVCCALQRCCTRSAECAQGHLPLLREEVDLLQSHTDILYVSLGEYSIHMISYLPRSAFGMVYLKFNPVSNDTICNLFEHVRLDATGISCRRCCVQMCTDWFGRTG